MRPLPHDLGDRIGREGQDLTILVVRLGSLGDVLRTLPPVRLVRAALPRASIFWALDERWGRLLEGHGDLDGLILLPREEWEQMLRSVADWANLARSIARIARDLRVCHIDVLLDFHGNFRSGMIGVLSGARVRIGYRGHQQKEGNRLFLTHTVPSGPRRTPRMDRNLDLVRALGLPDGPLPSGGLAIEAGRTDAQRIASGLAGHHRPYAVLSPGASRKQAYKKAPAALFGTAARILRDRSIVPLVAYGPGEEHDAAAVLRAGPAVVTPATDLRTLACLLQDARLFVGTDSGPLHLACAVGCPVLGLYGPTDPIVNAPWGVPNRAIYPRHRVYTGIKRRDRMTGGFEGIEEVEIEAAIDALLVGTAGAGPTGVAHGG